ncbi:MAG: carboxymuconolactone decarboxylase family protein [Spirochaetales bacterium]|nr:carboxymuconolactone decarboxylase family protein [Spirochaetales bacterium]
MPDKYLREDMKHVYAQFMDIFKKAGEAVPGYADAFMKFVGEGEKDGALSHKTKELISISLSIVQHCKFCIAFHVKEAIDAGATSQEILEASLVAGVMGGGPAVAYFRYVLDAVTDFTS